jgi:predicted dehydrogenase
MKLSLNRRCFLKTAAASAAGLWLGSPQFLRAQGAVAANEKLNIGIVGVAGQGSFSIGQLKDISNITALCDVDEKNLNSVGATFPAARKYRDFRRLVDQKDLDAIVVATPDHTHAIAAMAVLKSGRHLYCEKPLARTISETRTISNTARQTKCVTQIGTQIHAGNNYRRVVELIRSNAIGDVGEVHVWVNSSYGGKPAPKNGPPVPATLDWDLWLGPAQEHPYSPEYAPFNWRNWWAFGGGSLADFGCHFMDLPFWALDLHHPVAVAAEGPAIHPDSTPPWLIVRYDFPARIREGTKYPSLKLTWYHGGKYPEHIINPEQYQKWKGGIIFIGKKGMLLADYGRHVLLPEKDFEGFIKPSPFLPNSLGHHKEWIEAIKLGGTTSCRFDYSGPLTETALLGNVAYRVGKKLDWDFDNMRATNCPEGDQFIQHHYRAGWAI